MTDALDHECRGPEIPDFLGRSFEHRADRDVGGINERRADMGSMDHSLIGSIWRHKKSRHVYVIIGVCQLEATNTPAFLYRRPKEGITWARDMDEFLDGRFERVEV